MRYTNRLLLLLRLILRNFRCVSGFYADPEFRVQRPDLQRILSATYELRMISGTYDKLMTNLGETFDSL